MHNEYAGSGSGQAAARTRKTRRDDISCSVQCAAARRVSLYAVVCLCSTFGQNGRYGRYGRSRSCQSSPLQGGRVDFPLFVVAPFSHSPGGLISFDCGQENNKNKNTVEWGALGRNNNQIGRNKESGPCPGQAVRYSTRRRQISEGWVEKRLGASTNKQAWKPAEVATPYAS